MPQQPVEGLDAFRLALDCAIKIEGIRPPFNPNLMFNPNYFVFGLGADENGEYGMKVSEFLPHAAELQNDLLCGLKHRSIPRRKFQAKP